MKMSLLVNPMPLDRRTASLNSLRTWGAGLSCVASACSTLYIAPLSVDRFETFTAIASPSLKVAGNSVRGMMPSIVRSTMH